MVRFVLLWLRWLMVEFKNLNANYNNNAFIYILAIVSWSPTNKKILYANT